MCGAKNDVSQTTSGTDEECQFPLRNMLHSERLGSFLEAGWPDPNQASTSNISLCTAQKLALAGLEYRAKGEARCVVCWIVVTNLEPTTDPWIAHANANPSCPLIGQGKPNCPDNYTMQEFIELVRDRRIQYIKTKYKERKEEFVDMLATLFEIGRGIEHDEL